MDPKLERLLDNAATHGGRIVALTGAGISAESGIPTFRGKEGYWVVGSRHYHPQELATWEAYDARPELVWPWYLYRRAVCRASQPNAGHQALRRLDQELRDRFVLVTQNVDGLHLRAGNAPERTYEIHGNIDYMRCSLECSAERYPVPPVFDPWTRESALTDELWRHLRCPACGAMARPHVLWFDECYDEPRYRFESSLRAVQGAALLLVVGTAGATTLPVRMGQMAAQLDVPIVDVNPAANSFATLARHTGGYAAVGSSGEHLPEMARRLLDV